MKRYYMGPVSNVRGGVFFAEDAEDAVKVYMGESAWNNYSDDEKNNQIRWMKEHEAVGETEIASDVESGPIPFVRDFAGNIIEDGETIILLYKNKKVSNKWIIEKAVYVSRTAKSASFKAGDLTIRYMLQEDGAVSRAVKLTAVKATPAGDGDNKDALGNAINIGDRATFREPVYQFNCPGFFFAGKITAIGTNLVTAVLDSGEEIKRSFSNTIVLNDCE